MTVQLRDAGGNPVDNLALVRSIFFPTPGATLGSGRLRVLAIETSCDETGVALYDTRDGLLAGEIAGIELRARAVEVVEDDDGDAFLVGDGESAATEPRTVAVRGATLSDRPTARPIPRSCAS